MKLKEKEFSLSVTKEGDSVVSTGKPSTLDFESTYYSEYEEALEAIRDQCKSFVEDHKPKSPAHALRGRLGGMKKK